MSYKRQYKYPLSRYHAPLTKQEQSDLYVKIKNGDEEAKNMVISSCLPLVINLSKKFRYNNKHIDIEEHHHDHKDKKHKHSQQNDDKNNHHNHSNEKHDHE